MGDHHPNTLAYMRTVEANLGSSVGRWCLTVECERAEPVGGYHLGAGSQDRCDHPDLALGGTTLRNVKGAPAAADRMGPRTLTSSAAFSHATYHAR